MRNRFQQDGVPDRVKAVTTLACLLTIRALYDKSQIVLIVYTCQTRIDVKRDEVVAPLLDLKILVERALVKNVRLRIRAIVAK